MSGLAALLAGRVPPGVHTWHSGFEVADVRHTVEHAGWRFAHVDGLQAQTKPEFLRAAGRRWTFPDWYGQNFDALADCLGDVSGGEGTVLLWDGWGPLARSDPQAFSVALSVPRHPRPRRAGESGSRCCCAARARRCPGSPTSTESPSGAGHANAGARPVVPAPAARGGGSRRSAGSPWSAPVQRLAAPAARERVHGRASSAPGPARSGAVLVAVV